MTSGTPMTGRDTAAAYKGLIVGFLAIMLIVLSIVSLTNRKFANSEETPAATEQH